VSKRQAKAQSKNAARLIADFINGIGQKRTYRDLCYLATFAGKADISQRLPNNRDL
jgi:hypothetical protein